MVIESSESLSQVSTVAQGKQEDETKIEFKQVLWFFCIYL